MGRFGYLDVMCGLKYGYMLHVAYPLLPGAMPQQGAIIPYESSCNRAGIEWANGTGCVINSLSST